MIRGPEHRFATAALVVMILAGLMPAAVRAEQTITATSLPNPFYAYCVGIGVDKEAGTLEAQLRLPAILADLAYSGMAFVGLDGALEMLGALENRGQRLFAVYTPLSVDAGDRGYDPKLTELIPKLKGHGTIVWLVLNSKQHKPSSTGGDARAVELLREIADQAQRFGVSISLYPHRGAYAERMEDVVRLAQKADRKNIGVTFGLCHFLAVDDAKNLDRVLAMSRPYLTMVTISGTSGYDPKKREGWILTLDQGTFDVGSVLKTLRKLDYQGPIGIIAYGIKGDPRDILARSMTAWKQLASKAVSGKTK